MVLNILPPSYEIIYKAFSGQDVLPTFETIATCLIQEETHINTQSRFNASAKENALAMKV
jgi:hypothetical protein